MTPSSHTGSSSAFHTSPSLLLRVQADDQGAWTRLVDLHAPLVYHWCRRAQLGTEDTADDNEKNEAFARQNPQPFGPDRSKTCPCRL